MRMIMVMVLAVLAACASAPGGGAGLQGSYELVRINGGALPAPSPTEDGVTMHGATLRLMPDGRFTMDAKASTGEGEQVDDQVQGTWSVRGDSLAMIPDVRDDDPVPALRWTLDEGTLTLYDEHGHAYAFRQT